MSREIDHIIAREVMGWGPTTCGSLADGRGRGMESFFPSDDLLHAWEVVETMRRTYGIRMNSDLDGNDRDVWYFSFCRPGVSWSAKEASLPLAICEAAIKAVRA